MMRIADMNSFVAQVDVGENDIPKVKIGDTALITVDAYNNRKFKGLVYKIANPNTSGITTTTDVTNYKVHIRLIKESYIDLIKKGSFPFRPGMSASAEIQTRRETNILSIPLNAVTTRDKKDGKPSVAATKEAKPAAPEQTTDKENIVNEDLEEVVFVYDAKTTTVKKVKVKTGIQDLNFIQIVSGLKLGDEVISGPYNLISKTLKENDKIQKTEKDKIFDDKKKD